MKKMSAAIPKDNTVSNDNGKENEITKDEIDLLNNAGEDDEERELHKADLDSTDEEGDLLNERSSGTSKAGTDLDVPGAELDDEAEEIGEEDEENNSYSTSDNKEEE